MNENNYYRTYDCGDSISVYFPNGERYEIDSYDAEYSFRKFCPETLDGTHFYFTNKREASEFEDEVRRCSQEYYYNIRENILNMRDMW